MSALDAPRLAAPIAGLRKSVKMSHGRGAPDPSRENVPHERPAL